MLMAVSSSVRPINLPPTRASALPRITGSRKFRTNLSRYAESRMVISLIGHTRFDTLASPADGGITLRRQETGTDQSLRTTRTVSWRRSLSMGLELVNEI